METAEPEVAVRTDALRRAFPAGSQLSDATVLDIRPSAIGCLVVFTWRRSPRPFGLVVDLRDIGHEFVSGAPVASWEDWLSTFGTNLLAALDGGLVENSARTERQDFIELNASETWPYLPGIDYAVWEAEDLRLAATDLAVSGITVTAGDLTSGAVVAVVTGQAVDDSRPAAIAVVTRAEEASTAMLTSSHAHQVPPRMVLDCMRLACHEAAGHGISQITAEGDLPGLESLGFRPERGSARARVDTTFLHEDFGSPADSDATSGPRRRADRGHAVG